MSPVPNTGTAAAAEETVIDLREPAPPAALQNVAVRPRLSMVYGGGGAVGIAWHVAVIDALRDACLLYTSRCV